MIAERVHPPKNIVHPQGHPSQWLIMAHMETRKHPADVRPTEAAVVGIFHDVFVVVPIDKFVLQRWIKGGHSHDDDNDRDAPLQKLMRGPKGRCVLDLFGALILDILIRV